MMHQASLADGYDLAELGSNFTNHDDKIRLALGKGRTPCFPTWHAGREACLPPRLLDNRGHNGVSRVVQGNNKNITRRGIRRLDAETRLTRYLAQHRIKPS